MRFFSVSSLGSPFAADVVVAEQSVTSDAALRKTLIQSRQLLRQGELLGWGRRRRLLHVRRWFIVCLLLLVLLLIVVVVLVPHNRAFGHSVTKVLHLRG